MLPTIAPPERWARQKSSIDVLARREMVRKNVLRDCKRKIYKIEPARGFAGTDGKTAACLYVSGCSFFCQYCFVNPTSLSGAKGDFYTPLEAFEGLKKILLRTKNPQVQFNGGEIFLTPEWTVELVRLLSDFFEQECVFTNEEHPGRIWCDTMGFDLMREPRLFETLTQYKKHLALFISTKGHPDDYEIVSRAPAKFADEPFLVLEKAWQHELVAIPEVLDRMFWPERMDWYVKRLRAIHLNAPRVLHFDQYSPVNHVAWAPDKKLKVIGFRPNKSDGGRNAPLREEAIGEWQKRLMLLYGSGGMKPPYEGIDSPTFDCDRYPDESFRLVEQLILGQ